MVSLIGTGRCIYWPARVAVVENSYLVWPSWLRYGTDPLPLVGVVMLLALLAFPVYRHREPRAVIRPPGYRQPATETMPFAMFGISPAYADWGVEDGLSVLVRTNAPFLRSACATSGACKTLAGSTTTSASISVECASPPNPTAPHSSRPRARLLRDRLVEPRRLRRRDEYPQFADVATDPRRGCSAGPTAITTFGLAPRPGFEPGTYRLTAGRSTVELSRNGWLS